jgi:hypothetical protein
MQNYWTPRYLRDRNFEAEEARAELLAPRPWVTERDGERDRDLDERDLVETA